MNYVDIGRKVGLVWNGVWQCDEAKFREAIAIAQKDALTEAAELCAKPVPRPAGYGGRFEGYGSMMGTKDGSECATALLKLRDAP